MSKFSNTILSIIVQGLFGLLIHLSNFHFRNRFSSCLKQSMQSVAGRLFHDDGPNVYNTHRPSVTVCVCEKSKCWSSDERSWEQAAMKEIDTHEEDK